VSDGNLFRALSDGSASIVTGHIETFTERGVRLRDGEEIEADLIVTATGLNLLPLGGLSVRVDGRPIELSKTVSYKGMMVCGVPNLAVAFGYTNASWTLKCDLTSEYVCRLLNHMDERRFNWCVAREPGQSVRREPFIDFNSGYVARAIDGFPKQGSRVPWRLHQNYALDIMALRFGALEDGAIEFGHRTREAQPSEPLAA
jgi:cation diffusion facilitator CzcD-associated flavoprotein CzcO